MTALALSDPSRVIAGVVLLTIVTIEVGGWFLVRIARGDVPMTDFQKAFARAGHAHASVLVILALVGLLYVGATALSGPAMWVGRLGIPVAAVAMSGGFFAASAGAGRVRPNRFLALVWLGAASLAAGVLTLGLGLILGPN